jgi:hypothetical protein
MNKKRRERNKKRVKIKRRIYTVNLVRFKKKMKKMTTKIRMI